MIKVKEFSLGKIEYRLPNVVESMRLLAKLGVSGDGSLPKDNELVVIAGLIENLQPFVTKIDCKKGDLVIDSWEEALNHAEFLTPLSEMGTEVIQRLSGEQSGKGSRRKKS
jgi:hypothetical protein